MKKLLFIIGILIISCASVAAADLAPEDHAEARKIMLVKKSLQVAEETDLGEDNINDENQDNNDTDDEKNECEAKHEDRIKIFESPNEIDLEDYREFDVFDRPLYLAGELQFSSVFLGDHTLDNREKDDLLELEPAFNVELAYRLTEDILFFAEGEVQRTTEYLSEIGHTDNQWIFERTEHWLFFNDIYDSRLRLQVGRQTFEDNRQWWWDEQLDSIRAHYNRENIYLQIAAAQELLRDSAEQDRLDPEQKEVLRLLGHAAWSRDSALRLDLFGLYQDDRSNQPEEGEIIRLGHADERDSDLFWFGSRFSGELETDDFGSIEYWFDAAGVRGREKIFELEENNAGNEEVDEIIRRDVSGWGVDTGMTWQTGRLGDMSLTIGYAFASGDRSEDDRTDNAFRQTGFNDGDNRFQYYGELLNPDLSNLTIWTFAVGFPIGGASTLDFIYHQYRQDHAADFLWESELAADPTGNSRDIGWEIDIALTIEEFNNIEIESSAALFKAGDAFGPLADETAYRLKLQINYKL
ncbi:MAG: alginate export family protein [Desulfohalobiaceae bacterium]|nr:alginate export family protein [Desulfohalobiaceae bacterium]